MNVYEEIAKAKKWHYLYLKANYLFDMYSFNRHVSPDKNHHAYLAWRLMCFAREMERMHNNKSFGDYWM